MYLWNFKHKCHTMKKGFTLIELLVVIAIIAVIVAFSVTNYVGIRARAKDVKKKTELIGVKNALRLYYTDFNIYPGPATTTTNNFNGCGTASPPAASCASTCSGKFAWGTTGCDTVLMKQLPPSTDYTWSYRQMASGDDFCLWVSLENVSDADVVKSQAKCSTSCSAVVPSTSYVLCAD